MKISLILIVIVIVIAITGCGPKVVELPNTVGLNVDEGISKLNKVSKSFNIIKTYEHGINKEIDEIISVKHSGDEVLSNSEIELIINDAKSYELPDIKGLSIDESNEKLKEIGIEKEIEIGKEEFYSDIIEKDKIITAKNKKGGRIYYYIDKNGNIDCDEFTYVISKGKDERVRVPNVLGKSENDAINTLKKSGIKYSLKYEFPKTIDGSSELNDYVASIIK